LSGLDYPGMRMLSGSEFIGTLLQVEGIGLIIALILLVILAMCWFRASPLSERLRSGK